jgi:hypothetical protein
MSINPSWSQIIVKHDSREQNIQLNLLKGSWVISDTVLITPRSWRRKRVWRLNSKVLSQFSSSVIKK